MFDDKDNLIGLIFLIVCGAVAAAMIWLIVTGRQFSYNGPAWLEWVLGALFFGGVLYGMFSGLKSRRRGDGMEQWPDPNAGRPRKWWDWLFHREP